MGGPSGMSVKILQQQMLRFPKFQGHQNTKQTRLCYPELAQAKGIANFYAVIMIVCRG